MNMNQWSEEKVKKFTGILIGILALLVIMIGILLISMGMENGKEDHSSESVTQSQSETKTESESESETVSESQSETESETESEKETASEKESESESETVTESETESESENKPVPGVKPGYSTESGYKVYDPDNLRGLSTLKHGFSYGVAEGGKPHHQSVTNQKIFDEMANVKALALDTKTTEKVLYLTFDCGYEYDNNTAKILDILKEKEVKAAFFCTLDFLKDCPETSKRIIEEGHILGNHSKTHPVFPDITRNRMASELYGVDKHLRDVYGYESEYFRFPTGAYSENALELCTSVGYKSVFWSVAYDDWDTSNQRGHDYAYNKVTSRLHPGAVILLHAVATDNVSALGDIIDYARANGYTFRTLDEYPW